MRQGTSKGKDGSYLSLNPRLLVHGSARRWQLSTWGLSCASDEGTLGGNRGFLPPPSQPRARPQPPGGAGERPSVCLRMRPRGAHHDVVQRQCTVRGPGRVRLLVCFSYMNYTSEYPSDWCRRCLSPIFQLMGPEGALEHYHMWALMRSRT